MSRLAVYPFITYRTDTTLKLPFGFYAFTPFMKGSTAFFAVVLFGSSPRHSCQLGQSSSICSRHRGKKEEDIEKVAGHTVLAGYGEGVVGIEKDVSKRQWAFSSLICTYKDLLVLGPNF
jgi:hypothetical protein